MMHEWVVMSSVCVLWLNDDIATNNLACCTFKGWCQWNKSLPTPPLLQHVLSAFVSLLPSLSPVFFSVYNLYVGLTFFPLNPSVISPQTVCRRHPVFFFSLFFLHLYYIWDGMPESPPFCRLDLNIVCPLPVYVVCVCMRLSCICRACHFPPCFGLACPSVSSDNERWSIHYLRWPL